MRSYQELEAELYAVKAQLEQARNTVEDYYRIIAELTDKLTDARAEAKFQKAKAERWEEFSGQLVRNEVA